MRVPPAVRRRALRPHHAGHRLPAAFREGGRDHPRARASPVWRPSTHSGGAGGDARRVRLRRAGLSRQKLGYLKDLARRAAAGRLPLEALEALPDEAVIEALTAVRGVGVWTAQMFLMFRLGRLDVLPVLDLGIQKGMRLAYGLRRLPKPAQMERIAATLAPVPQRRQLVPLAGARGPAAVAGLAGEAIAPAAAN